MSTQIVPDASLRAGTGIRSSRNHRYAVCGCTRFTRAHSASFNRPQKHVRSRILTTRRTACNPSDWTETTAGQTRRVLAVCLSAFTAAATLLLRAAQSAPHPLATGPWLTPLAAGALLAAPLPRPRWPALRRLCAEAARTMAVPAAALVAMIVLANSGAADHQIGAAHVALVAYYWTTLAFIALRACTLIARILPTCKVPTTRRLRAALLLAGSGMTLAAGQGTFAAFQAATADAGALAVTVAFGLLAALTLQTGQDLKRSSA
jgi:hypothetical protein